MTICHCGVSINTEISEFEWLCTSLYIKSADAQLKTHIHPKGLSAHDLIMIHSLHYFNAFDKNNLKGQKYVVMSFCLVTTQTL